MTVDPPAERSALVLALQRRRVRAAPGDLADLALLRRNLPRLPEGVDPRAIALITPQCGASSEAQNAGLLIACLWATRHRLAAPVDSSWNLGHALRAVPQASAERAWRDICTATAATLPRRMTGVMNVLAHSDVATDWHRLHRDLRSWYQGFPHLVLGRWSTGLFGPAVPTPTPHRATAIGSPDAPLVRLPDPRPAKPSELSS